MSDSMPRTPPKPDERKWLLVVDDQTSVREILAEGLEYMGYEAKTAGSAAQAFEMIRNERPALVLTDIDMPDETGIELLNRIKAHDQELDVIMVTGIVDAETAIQAIALAVAAGFGIALIRVLGVTGAAYAMLIQRCISATILMGYVYWNVYRGTGGQDGVSDGE